MTRRGVTLVELTIGLVLSGLIGTVVVRATLHLGRAVGVIQQRAASATALDQGLMYLGAELSEVGPGDVRRAGADSISYRGYRAAGLACRVTASAVDVVLQGRTGARGIQAGRDTLLLYRGGADSIAWMPLPVLATAGGLCAGEPALRITTMIDSTTLAVVSTMPLVPVRFFEMMQARLYRSADQWWLGARSESAGELVQPLAGPFDPGGGWSYRDSLDASTSAASAIRRMTLRLSARDTALLLVFPPNLRP